MLNFTKAQYEEIWDMIFQITGYPPHHPKHESKSKKEEHVSGETEIRYKKFIVQEEPQWEILEYNNCGHIFNFGGIGIRKKMEDGLFYFTEGENKTSCNEFELRDWNINSVKRFPDNTVWSVGDDTQHGKISAFKIIGSTMVAEIKNNVFPYDYPLYLSELKAPKEEQVPIKVESVVFYTSMSEKPIRDVFSVRLTGDISEDKLQPIKKAIQSVINNDGLSEYFNKQPKLYSESELLQARRDAFKEARLAWASSIKQPFDGVYKHETVEDYINSLK